MNSVIESLLKGENVRQALGEAVCADPKFVAWVQDRALEDFEVPFEYHNGPNFIEVVGSTGGDVITRRYYLSDFKAEIKESNEESYISCDACGAEPSADDFVRFADFQFCPVCYHRLETYIPKRVLDFCKSVAADDEDVAHFILSVADKTYF